MPCTQQSHWQLFAASRDWFWCRDDVDPEADGAFSQHNRDKANQSRFCIDLLRPR